MQAAQCSDSFNVTEKIYGVSKLFIAPEVLTNPKKVTGKADVYSLGVMLYALIANDLKETTNTKHQCYDPVLDFSQPQWSRFSCEIKEFI